MNIETTDKEDMFEKFKEHYLACYLSYLRRDIQYDLHSEIHVRMNPDYSGVGIRAMIKDKIMDDMCDEFKKFCSFNPSDYSEEIDDFADDFVQENLEIEVRFTK